MIPTYHQTQNEWKLIINYNDLNLSSFNECYDFSSMANIQVLLTL